MVIASNDEKWFEMERGNLLITSCISNWDLIHHCRCSLWEAKCDLTHKWWFHVSLTLTVINHQRQHKCIYSFKVPLRTFQYEKAYNEINYSEKFIYSWILHVWEFILYIFVIFKCEISLRVDAELLYMCVHINPKLINSNFIHFSSSGSYGL